MTDLIKQLTGRARFCRDRGEEKTPGLLEEAAAQFADAQAAQAMVRFWKHMAETHNDRATALAAANAVLEAKVAGLVEALRNLVGPDCMYDGRNIVITAVNHGDAIRLVAEARAALATQEAGT